MRATVVRPLLRLWGAGNTRRALVVIVTGALLAGVVAMLPSASAELPAGPVGRLAAPTDAPYRIGFSTTDSPQVVDVPLTGGDQAVLVAGPAGDASARGSALAWIDRGATGGARERDGDLFYRPSAAVATPRRLTNDDAVDRHPVISPDGGRVAFESDRAGTFDIWVVGTGGGTPRRVTTGSGSETWPTWSPDGQQLAFVGTDDDSNGDIYRVPASGGTPTRLTTYIGTDTEPAWAPTGNRIAYTTRQFTPAGDIALISATGGNPTRAVPGDGDSSQAAWTSSGALVFVSFRADKLGDVFRLVESSNQVVPVANEPNVAESRPSPHGQNVAITRVADGNSGTDVWTANRDGVDRGDHTFRPTLDEFDPAFSPDGTKVAYAQEQPGGGTRVVISDATGVGEDFVVPAGTQTTDVDTEPTWSPDGTMLAFGRRSPPAGQTFGGEQRVLIVRVADDRLLGTIPVPVGTITRDYRPEWSPDGVRLAFTRAADRDAAVRVNPPAIGRPVRPGQDFSVGVDVAVPDLPQRPEIVFLVDGTYPMNDVIDNVIAPQISDWMDQVRDDRPDARFGVAVTRDATSTNPFEAHRVLTSRLHPISFSAITIDPAGSPANVSQWINGLHEVATGTPGRLPNTQPIVFTPGAKPIVVLFSDVSSAEPSFGHRLTNTDGSDGDTMTALKAAGITVIVVNTTSGTPGVNGNGNQADKVAAATGGKVVTMVGGPNAIREALDGPVRTIPTTVRPTVDGCDTGLTAQISPASRETRAGATVRFDVRVSVSGDATPGDVLHCQISYPVPGNPTHIQDVAVRVADRADPVVALDDAVVLTTNPLGQVITYNAAASDADGDSLDATCTPPSGTRFPIGTTTVTCSVTDGGRTVTDTATFTVVRDETYQFSSDVWIATLDFPTPDSVVVTGQVNLSVRVGGPCNPDQYNYSPAWSPDAKRIVYVDEGDERDTNLCDVNVDGTEPRFLLSAADADELQVLDDPAFSPDGTFVAFADFDGEGPGGRIMSVPSAGGPMARLIFAAEYAADPAFWILPRPSLSLTAGSVPRPSFVGGDDIAVTYTLRNNTDRPLVNAILSTTLPGQLPVRAKDPRCESATRCAIGFLPAQGSVSRTVRLGATTALTAQSTGQATAAQNEGGSVTANATTPVEVRAPVLTLQADVGPPGFVPRADGANFPPGATVRLVWRDGLTAKRNTVTVQPDGTFKFYALIFPKDRLGPRQLVAERVSGPRFGAVRDDFLVVPETLNPPDYVQRR